MNLRSDNTMEVYTGNPKCLTKYKQEEGSSVSFSITEWSEKLPTTKEFIYESPTNYYCHFQNAIVTSFPSVIITTQDNRIWFDQLFRFASGRFQNQDFWQRLSSIVNEKTHVVLDGYIKEFDSPVIPLFNNGNLFHWVCENIPKIKYIEKYNLPGKILTQTLETYQRESLEYFSSNIRNRIVELEAPVAIKAPDIFVIATPSVKSGKVSPWVVPYLRNTFLKNINTFPFRRLYITRNDAAGRRVENEQDILPVLKKYDIKYISLSDYSFHERNSIPETINT